MVVTISCVPPLYETIHNKVSTENKARVATEEEINDARWKRLRRLGKKVRGGRDLKI